MPASHGRVAQPSYLRREPPHVAGQLLQLVHCGNTLFSKDRCIRLPNGGGGGRFSRGIKYRDSPCPGAQPSRIRRYTSGLHTGSRVTGRSALRGAIAASYYQYYATPPMPAPI
jgi:hypothetical protein